VSLSGLWIGHVSGTNIGLASIRLQHEGERLTGEVVLDDSQYGMTQAHLEGSIQG
jgi:hypothetical protein